MRAFLVVLTTLATLTLVPLAVASSPLPTGTRVEGNCVWIYDFPDAGYAICTGRAECKDGLYSKTVTFTGTEEKCLL